jgi:hypothetical protein
LSSATHHILFRPRFEIVVQEQDPDGFSPHAWNQSPFHGFFRHRAHGPPGATFGRIAANHRDNALLNGWLVGWNPRVVSDYIGG